MTNDEPGFAIGWSAEFEGSQRTVRTAHPHFPHPKQNLIRMLHLGLSGFELLHPPLIEIKSKGAHQGFFATTTTVNPFHGISHSSSFHSQTVLSNSFSQILLICF